MDREGGGDGEKGMRREREKWSPIASVAQGPALAEAGSGHSFIPYHRSSKPYNTHISH